MKQAPLPPNGTRIYFLEVLGSRGWATVGQGSLAFLREAGTAWFKATFIGGVRITTQIMEEISQMKFSEKAMKIAQGLTPAVWSDSAQENFANKLASALDEFAAKAVERARQEALDCRTGTRACSEQRGYCAYHAAHLARQEEREACAQLCDKHRERCSEIGQYYGESAALGLAVQIRAGGDQ